MATDNSNQELIVNNLGLVKGVIYSQIKINETIQGLGYDDLYQVGCMALCHAASTYNESSVPFEAFAKIVVKNKLIDHCRQALRQHHGQLYLDNPVNDSDGCTLAERIPDTCSNYFESIEQSGVLSLLNSVKPGYNGITLKGIEAIELKVKGYSGKEIAELYGVKPNHVGAWISRAASKLRCDQRFLAALNLWPTKKGNAGET